MSEHLLPRHTVWIPAPYRELSGGVTVVTVAGANVRAVVDALEGLFPGLKARLCTDDRLRPGIAVAVNGVLAPRGLRHPLDAASEIHFIPAVRGG